MSQQINLFNPIFMKQRKYFSLPAMLQALGLIVVGALLFYGYASYQVGQLSKQAEESTKRFNTEQTRLAGNSTGLNSQQEDQALQDEVQQLEKKATEQADLVDALKSGVLGNTAGYSEYMRAFSRQVVEGLWLTGFKVTGDTSVTLSGGVSSPNLLPAYIQRLGREHVMQGKKFTNLQMQQPKPEEGAEASKKPVSAPRYIEFTLYSSPDNKDKQ